MMLALQNGTQHAVLSKLGEVFDYKVFEDGKAYQDLSDAENAKVNIVNETFAAIYFEKTADGLAKSSESIFKCVNGSSNFNISDDKNIVEDYVGGRNVYELDVYSFDLVRIIE